jgi:hypothetical protein
MVRSFSYARLYIEYERVATLAPPLGCVKAIEQELA